MIQIGIIGTGFGSYGLLPAFRRDSRCVVTAIAASSQEKANAVASKLNIPQAFGHWEDLVMNREVDAIAIATPPVIQPLIALAAMSHKKPVFAEKPIASTVVEAEKLTRVADETRLANVVDFIFPELVTFRKAKELIHQDIGSPLHVVAEWIFWSADHANDATTWRTDSHAGGGALAHYGSHMIYYLEWFFGPIVSVSANIARPINYRHSGDTLASLLLSFESGMTGTLIISSGSPIAAKHSITVLGVDGSVLLSNETENPIHGFKLKHYRGRKLVGDIILEPEETGIDCRVPAVSKIAHRFIDWILTGQTTRPSFKDGLSTQRIIEITTKSKLL